MAGIQMTGDPYVFTIGWSKLRDRPLNVEEE
jgi:hypothetical protein